MDDRKVRNIGISAHIDSGKTTLTERILFIPNAFMRYMTSRGRTESVPPWIPWSSKRNGV